MIRLAFSTNAFKKHSLCEAVNAIADSGYSGVEIMADVPHANPATFDSASRTALKRQLADRGLQVSNVNAFTLFAAGDTYHPTWIEDDSSLRDTRIRHTIQSIELAAELGAATISVQPGGPLIGGALSRGAAADRFVDGLRRVLPTARDDNITIAVEPEPGLLIESSREYLQFKREYFRDEPLVKMNCDIGHLFCVGDDPADVVRNMPREIAHVHLEDIGADRVHQHLPLGKGVIEFRAIFAALKDTGYAGWVTVELYPYEAAAAEVAAAAHRHLQSIVSGPRHLTHETSILDFGSQILDRKCDPPH